MVRMTTIETAPCSSCRDHFRTVNGLVRDHDVRAGNPCCGSGELEVKPDLVMDFRSLPFADESFNVVIFDPPHLVHVGRKSWTFAKYGGLSKTWQDDLEAGFAECFRVLRTNGVLIFKWNEIQIPVGKILALTPHKPLVGHRSGKRSDTHWMTFLKSGGDS